MPDQKTTTALDILEAEVNLAVARCKRIGLERKIADEHDDHFRTGIVGITTATETEEERRHLHQARVVVAADECTSSDIGFGDGARRLQEARTWARSTGWIVGSAED